MKIIRRRTKLKNVEITIISRFNVRYFLLSTFVEFIRISQRALTSSLLPTLRLPILPLTSVALFKLILFFFCRSCCSLSRTMQSTKLYCVLFVTCCLSFSHALECYVCTNQEGNREKCLKSTKTCEQGQDTCLTEIRWGSTPYWSQGAKKQFYVSKRCATKKECERIKHSNMDDCTYIWYQDWKCSDCCQGDKCNYYVISAAKRDKHAYWLVITAALISVRSLQYRVY